jgi:hypothetical protein
LDQPCVREFDGCHETRVGEGIDGVEQRVGEDVVIGRELRLNTRHRDETSNAEIHALGDMRKVDVNVFECRVESIFAMAVDELRDEIAFVDCKAVISPIKGSEMEANVCVLLLYRVREALEVEHHLIEFETVGVKIVGFR